MGVGPRIPRRSTARTAVIATAPSAATVDARFTPARLRDRHPALLDREHSELGPRHESVPIEQAMQMGLDGLLRHAERCRDLGVRPAAHHRGDNLQFAFRWTSGHGTRGGEVGSAEGRAACRDCPDRIDDRPDFDGLVEIAGGSTLDGRTNHRRVAVTGQQQHGGRGSLLACHLEHANALGLALELDVAQQDVHVRQQKKGVIQGVTRAGQDEVVGLVDRSTDGGQDGRVIVDDADADRARHRRAA